MSTETAPAQPIWDQPPTPWRVADATLRPLAGELAAFFRQQSEVVQPDGFAVRWALAVPGETDGAL